MMCIHPFQEGKDSCEGNSFLHAFFFVVNTLVPRTTTITQLSCLQTFVPHIEQTSFLPTSSMLFSSPHHPPYSSFLSLGRDTRWLARARRLDCDAMATAVPNAVGMDACCPTRAARWDFVLSQAVETHELQGWRTFVISIPV